MTTKQKVKDPVCGMEIDPDQAAANVEHDGETYYFCSDSCHSQFEANPSKYVSTNGEATSEEATHDHSDHAAETQMPAVAESATSARSDLPLLGMSCASCAGRIEKALNKAPGVEKATVNFATARATVNYNPQQTTPEKLRDAVKSAGYDAIIPQLSTPTVGGHGAQEHGGESDLADAEQKAREDEYAAQKRKFFIALVLTIPVAILGMGHLIPALGETLNFPGRAWVELALTTPVLFWAGREFFTGAWGAAKHRAADMNTLIAIGTSAAYFYSVVVTAAPQLLQSAASTHSEMPGVYFEVAAIVVTLILMGRLLEAKARSQTSGAIRALMGLQAKTARCFMR